jgi:hypothetical protein
MRARGTMLALSPGHCRSRRQIGALVFFASATHPRKMAAVLAIRPYIERKSVPDDIFFAFSAVSLQKCHQAYRRVIAHHAFQNVGKDMKNES